MEEKPSSKSDNKKSRLKLKISIVVLLLIVITFFGIIILEQNKPDLASAAVIRNEAAMQLGKDPNELTNEDFAAVKKLNLSGKKVYDINLLEKFTNLEELKLSSILLPKPDVPKWKVILAKVHINLSKRYIKRYKEKYFIDLSPLEKLTNLRALYIQHTAFKDIKSLAKIENLKDITVTPGQLEEYEDFESIQKKFPGMIYSIDNATPTPIRDVENRIKSEFEN